MIEMILNAVGLGGKRFKFDFHVIGFVLFFSAVLAIALGAVANSMESSSELPGVAVTAVRVVATSGWVVFAGTVAVVGFGLVVNVLNRMKGFVTTETIPDEAEKPETDVIDVSDAVEIVPQYANVLRDGELLRTAIRDINISRENALVRISDASTLAHHFSQMIQGAAEAANRIDAEVADLRGALAAVRTRSEEDIAYYVGALQDRTMATLLSTFLTREGLSSKVVEAFAIDIGSLESQSRAIESLARHWIGLVSQARGDLLLAETTARELGAAPFLVEIDAHLAQAEDALGLANASPAAVQAARALPVIENTPKRLTASSKGLPGMNPRRIGSSS